MKLKEGDYIDSREFTKEEARNFLALALMSGFGSGEGTAYENNECVPFLHISDGKIYWSSWVFGGSTCVNSEFREWLDKKEGRRMNISILGHVTGESLESVLSQVSEIMREDAVEKTESFEDRLDANKEQILKDAENEYLKAVRAYVESAERTQHEWISALRKGDEDERVETISHPQDEESNKTYTSGRIQEEETPIYPTDAELWSILGKLCNDELTRERREAFEYLRSQWEARARELDDKEFIIHLKKAVALAKTCREYTDSL